MNLNKTGRIFKYLNLNRNVKKQSRTTPVFCFLIFLLLQIIRFERTGWMLFHKRVVHTKFDIYHFITTFDGGLLVPEDFTRFCFTATKTLNCLAFKSFDFDVHDTSYSRNASCALNLIIMSLLLLYSSKSICSHIYVFI
jgi:hypothetical protein